VVLVTATATATTNTPSHARGARSAASPFARAWAHVPRTPAGRSAKSVLAYGIRNDVAGFNTILACCNALEAGYMGATEAGRGAFVQDNRGV
jgi:hypothetical protein